MKKIAAIIPAYNEAKHIKPVLKTLKSTNIIDEIIVIDDCSKDNTKEIVKKLKIKYLRNKTNKGKAYSMNKGVKKTDADIIFFCDADIIGLTPDIVKNIIKPVLNNKYIMFIGGRSNTLQKYKFNIKLSGERALKRKLWEKTPEFFKKRYRIEMGLNHYAKKYGKYNYKIFKHKQRIKEKKYNLIKGIILRIWMDIDILSAYIYIKLKD